MSPVLGMRLPAVSNESGFGNNGLWSEMLRVEFNIVHRQGTMAMGIELCLLPCALYGTCDSTVATMLRNLCAFGFKQGQSAMVVSNKERLDAARERANRVLKEKAAKAVPKPDAHTKHLSSLKVLLLCHFLLIYCSSRGVKTR